MKEFKLCGLGNAVVDIFLEVPKKNSPPWDSRAAACNWSTSPNKGCF
jgi:hypothetical protein